MQCPCETPDDLQPFRRLDFSNLNLYLPLLPQLIESIQKQAGVRVPAVRAARHNDAPALPENFVPRPQLLEALRNTLFTAGIRNIALTANTVAVMPNGQQAIARAGDRTRKIRDLASRGYLPINAS